MPRTDQQIDLLWTTVFGQPPPITAAPELLLAVLVEHLPLAPPYGPRCVAIDAEQLDADPADAAEHADP